MARDHPYPKPGTYKEGVAVVSTIKRATRKSVARAEVGPDKSFRRMLEQEAFAHDEMEEHRANGELVLAGNAFDRWSKLAAAIGTGETRELKNRVYSRELVPATEVQDEYRALFRNLPAHFRAGLRDMRWKIDNPPPAPVWDAMVDSLLDEFFGALPKEMPGL